MNAALAVFVKTPGYSPVKTRLASAIGMGAATAFHGFAARAVGGVARAVGEGLKPYWAVAECDALDAWPGPMPRLWQGEDGLGERMERVYGLLRTTHDRVLLVGADVPQVTPDLLRQACAALDGPATPFVLGEATDGGFWLVGGRAPIPAAVWHDVRYSRPDTAVKFLEALGKHGGIAVLPTLTDVDRASDLPGLAAALAALSAPLPAQRELLEWLRRDFAGAGESFSGLDASTS